MIEVPSTALLVLEVWGALTGLLLILIFFLCLAVGRTVAELRDDLAQLRHELGFGDIDEEEEEEAEEDKPPTILAGRITNYAAFPEAALDIGDDKRPDEDWDSSMPVAEFEEEIWVEEPEEEEPYTEPPDSPSRTDFSHYQ